MFSQIAQVFSSQGVVLPGSEFVPVRSRAAPVDARDTGFAAVFDQASAKLDLSKQARARMGRATSAQGKPARPDGDAAGADATGTKSASGRRLSADEQKAVEALQQRDAEVHRHEQAHLASAGGYAKGGAQFEYQTGPDGKAYAVGGSVAIDASPVSGNPQATLAKAMIVQRAALAPADPSGDDRAVAAAAAQMAIEAQRQLAEADAKKPGLGNTEVTGETGDPGNGQATRLPAPHPGGKNASSGNVSAASGLRLAYGGGRVSPPGLRFSVFA